MRIGEKSIKYPYIFCRCGKRMKPLFESDDYDHIPLTNFHIVCPDYSLDNDQHDSFRVDEITEEEAKIIKQEQNLKYNSISTAKSWRTRLKTILIITAVVFVIFLLVVFFMPGKRLYTERLIRGGFNQQDNIAILSVSIGSANGSTTKSFWDRQTKLRDMIWNFTGIDRTSEKPEEILVNVRLKIDQGLFQLIFLDEENMEIDSLEVQGSNEGDLKLILPVTALKNGQYRVIAKKAKGILYDIYLILPETAPDYCELGSIYSMKGQPDKAEIAFKKSIDLDPNYDLSYFNWGNLLLDHKVYDRAIEMYKKSLKLEPRDAIAYNNWGNALQGQKKYEKAIDMYRKSIEFDPDYAFAYSNWGNALSRLKDFKGAIAKHKESIKINPNYINAYINLSEAYTQMGLYDEAIASYKKIIEIDPNISAVYGNMGWAYYLKDDFNRCIELSEKVLALDSFNLIARYNISLCYLRLGQTAKAKTLYSKTKEFNLSKDWDIPQGVIDDLLELIDQNIRSEETRMILTEIFLLKDEEINKSINTDLYSRL